MKGAKKFVVLFAIVFVFHSFRPSCVQNIKYSTPISSMSIENPNSILNPNNSKYENQTHVRILAWTDFFGRKFADQIDVHRSLQECREKYKITCEITHNRSLINESQGVVFHSRSMKSRDDIPSDRNLRQPWIHVNRESPAHEGNNVVTNYPEMIFNWTMSYRRHSDVYHPYGRFVRKQGQNVGFNERVKILSSRPKLVAWVVSNCNPSSRRVSFVKRLQEYIPVHIYGGCGNYSCQTGVSEYPDSCMPQLAKEYKFYLALENSFCYEYITEKLFNPLNHSVIPIVFGHGPYADKLPPNSFINVQDFSSVKELAQLILELDRDNSRYAEYLKWTEEYTIELGNGWCNLCRKLAENGDIQSSLEQKFYTDNPNTFKNVPVTEKNARFGGLMKGIGYSDKELENLENLDNDCII